MMNNKEKIIGYFLLVIAIILFIYSFYFIYQKSHIETTISSKKLENQIKGLNKEIEREKITQFKYKDLSTIPYTIQDIFNQTKLLNPKSLQDCNSFSKDKKNNCIYIYYLHKYSQLTNIKGVIDIKVCNNIKEKFGQNEPEYGRCMFMYAVAHGTKYKNIQKCSLLPKEKDLDPNNRNGYKSYESCVDLVTYSVFGKDSVLGKYMKVLDKRGDKSKSAIGNKIINKYGTYIDGKAGGVEFVELSLKKYLQLQINNYNTNKTKFTN